MKQLGLVAGAALVGLLAWFMLTHLSSDALGMAIGFVFGVLAGIPAALLVLATSRRPARDDDDDEDDYREQARRYPEPYSYQPPVIVLAAPMAQEPQTVNNYHAPSVTIHAPAGGMPLLADREREIQTQRGGRVFRVVGEREGG